MPGSRPATRRRGPRSRPSSLIPRSRSRSWCRRRNMPGLHRQRAGARRPFLLVLARSPASRERHVTANVLELVFRDASQLLLVEISFKNEAPEDQRELRVAIVEQLVDLPPSVPQLISNRPHVVDRHCGGRLCLELSHCTGQHRLTCRVKDAARDLLLGIGPPSIAHGSVPSIAAS